MEPKHAILRLNKIKKHGRSNIRSRLVTTDARLILHNTFLFIGDKSSKLPIFKSKIQLEDEGRPYTPEFSDILDG